MKPRFTLTISLFWLYASVQAQLPRYLTFRHYTTKDGLASHRIDDLIQDRQGFLWIATENGLNRFDGEVFKLYTLPARQAGQLPDGTRTCLALDGQGHLWALSQLGLSRYDHPTNQFRSVKTPLDGHSIRDNHHLLYDSTRACLWLTTSRGLFRHSLRTGTTTRTSVRTLFRPFRTLLTPDGRLLIAASEGAFVYNPATDQSRFYPVDDDGNEHFISAFSDADGQLWMGRNGRGLVHFDPGTGQATHYYPPPSLVKSTFVSIVDIATVPAITGDSILWLATHDYGLLFFNRYSRQFVGRHTASPLQPEGLFTSQIDRLYLGHNGQLWLANQALGQFDPANQAMHTELLNMPHINMQYMVPNRERAGHYWVASNGFGLLDYDLNTHTIAGRLQHNGHPISQGIANPNTHPESFVHELHYDHTGRLWVTSVAGVHCYESGKPPRLFRLGVNGQRSYANVVTTDEAGIVWGSVNERLFRLDPDTRKFRVIQLPAWPGQTDFPIPTQIYISGPFIWVGSTVGLFQLNPQTGQVLNRYRDTTSGDPLLTNAIHGITRDQQGDFWLACHEHGLKRLGAKTGRFERVAVLDSEQVHPFSVRCDRRGYLWMQTTNGFYRYQPITRRLAHFQSVGPHSDLEYYALPMPDPTGGWFAVQGGNYLTRFDPERVPDHYPPPRPCITSFRIFDKPQRIAPDSAGQPAHFLPHEQNVITFEFASPQFSRMEAIRFAYRLDGFDAGWTEAGTRRAVTYTNLDGGNYRFRVRAANNIGQWHPQEAQFRLRVETPYWRTWWFYLGCAGAFIGAVFGLFKAREQQRLRLLLIRERIARDLHDDMGSQLSSISMLSEAARKLVADHPDRAESALTRIGETARQTLDAMGDLVWSVNPSHDAGGQVLERMRQLAEDLFAETATVIQFNVPSALPALMPQKRREVLLIYKEILTNAARYANATHLTISLKQDRGRLLLRVSDNGRGFDPAQPTPRPGGGNGLANMHHRAAQLGGQLTIESQPGVGTTVTLQV